ncbi:MAG: antitoxin [Eggerthellaceae bacterium]|nr:antitoxin [Eggerthellaceae bacterium]
MPQLSLYLNEPTMALLREDCQKSGNSLSRYVSELITAKRTESSWPQGYWDNVYGALDDDSFQVPSELDGKLDGELPEF